MSKQNITTMLTTIEAAKEIGVNPSRVRQLVRAGVIAGVMRGGTWFFTRDQIEQVKARNTKTGPKLGKKQV